jgi:hypothetical protein
MTTDLNPDSWDSEGNLLVPLHGIRIALGLSFLAAAGFLWFAYLGDKQWHEQNPGGGADGLVIPLWMSTLRIALPLVPFILSALLLSTSSENSKAAGAGVAVALFSSGLLRYRCLVFFPFYAVLPGSLRTARADSNPYVSCLQRLDFGFSLSDRQSKLGHLLPDARGNHDLPDMGNPRLRSYDI